MVPFATIEDLRKHWADLPDELDEMAGTKLEEASIIIRGLYSGIDARIALGKLNPETVRLVVCQMVATLIRRELDAPEGEDIAQQSFTAGGFSQSLQFRIRDAELFLSALQRKLLSGGGARSRKAFMIVPGR
ncbi:hypothetical protein [Glutamicibacter protophormiae]|uniref:hypothetical protein n=1 Tax=Glutamicibacter protophormiae TaxID=37930 RepID=UPI003A8EC691